MPFYWRISLFYFFYFATLGAIIPYWGLYLKSLGFSPQAIGTLMAILMATKIIAPNLWGWLGDHLQRRMAIVRLASFLAALAFAGVLLDTSFLWLAAVMATFSFFWNAALPQFEATTLNHLGPHAHRYSLIRVWGSVGFIAAVAILGQVLEHHGTSSLPVVILLLLGGIGLSSLGVPEAPTASSEVHPPFWAVLRQPGVLAFLAACFLIQASHGPYYAFFSIYLEEHGYARGVIGQLWALGVIAEVGVFLLLSRLMERHGMFPIFAASLFLAALRWLAIGWGVDHPPVMVLAQILHAASFGSYHGVAMALVHRFFTGRHQGRGQALYSSLSFGAGGAVGSLYSGYTWELWGGAWTYTLASLLSLAALGIAWHFLRSLELSDHPPYLSKMFQQQEMR
ncbi:MAG: MFS transporter [Gammaproteobacteria bacterium]|nr:MAG: MFS transporter [Gammaproteobacteria bacterium]